MTPADLKAAFTAQITHDPGPKPLDKELDLFGITHPGKVRAQNQDHFFVGTVHPQVVMHGTSLPAPDQLPLRGERLATVMMVADGVGGGPSGAEASQVAVETITRYVSMSLRSYHAAGSVAEEELLDSLRAAATQAHAAVQAEQAKRQEGKKMATTLTLGIFVWPWAYVVQVGDSRFYVYSDGKLRQVTRDQTMAQDLVDLGVLPPERLKTSPYSNVLARAIGASEATPEVTRIGLRRPMATMLCTDGLTKHVSDAEIADRLERVESSEQSCRGLLDLALERGGTDNITVLVGRLRR